MFYYMVTILMTMQNAYSRFFKGHKRFNRNFSLWFIPNQMLPSIYILALQWQQLQDYYITTLNILQVLL